MLKFCHSFFMCFTKNTICPNKSFSIKTIYIIDRITSCHWHKLNTAKLYRFIIET